MAAKKKKSKGLPVPIVKGLYSEAVLEKDTPPYSDSGVRFEGYAKVRTATGWQLLKQNAKKYAYFGVSGTVTHTKDNSKTFYCTTVTFEVSTYDRGSCGVFDVVNGNSTQRFQLLDADTVTSGQSQCYTKSINFDVPVPFYGDFKFIQGGTAGSYFDIQLFGYEEDRI